jgi:hypothetical protein
MKRNIQKITPIGNSSQLGKTAGFHSFNLFLQSIHQIKEN